MDVNTRCPGCDAPRSLLIRDGLYSRTLQAKLIQRFQVQTLCEEVLCGHLQRYFPNSTHTVPISDRGCVLAQGELKKTCFDYLTSVIHSFANIRPKVNRSKLLSLPMKGLQWLDDAR